MRCRQIKNGEVVWFNSIGKDISGNKISAENYVENQKAISNSLTQRLSVLKNELWYNINYGLPLFDKVKSKTFMDTTVTQIIMSHPEVIRIINFTSQVKNNVYRYKATIISTYGQLVLNTYNATI